MQMIGRGTRLCPGLFGNKDKEEFYIFDWCNNFEYFSVHTEGADPVTVKSLTERLFSLRLDIAFALQSAEHQEKEADKRLHDELKEMLHKQVDSLSVARIDVREKIAQVEPYRSMDAWVCLSDVDVAKLKGIASLLPRPNENEAAKKFDILMLHLQLEKVDSTVNADKCRTGVIAIARMLEAKASIPVVKERIDTIREVQTVRFWETSTIDRLERVRKELRELVHILEEGRGDRKFIIDIEDTTTADDEAARVALKATYKQRVIEYLACHNDNEALNKIQNFEQLSPADIEELQRIFWEELGTREEYNRITGGKRYNNNVAAFIRVIKGIDRKKALEKYAQFIKGANLTSEQEQYLKNILDYISVNGDILLSDFTEYPLKRYPWRNVFGNQFVCLKDFIKEIHNVISITA